MRTFTNANHTILSRRPELQMWVLAFRWQRYATGGTFFADVAKAVRAQLRQAQTYRPQYTDNANQAAGGCMYSAGDPAGPACSDDYCIRRTPGSSVRLVPSSPARSRLQHSAGSRTGCMYRLQQCRSAHACQRGALQHTSSMNFIQHLHT